MVIDDSRRADNPIGVFDSGLGGLTVARSIIDLLPHEDLVYFGDTERCPYGPRPRAEIKRFAFEIMDLLVAEDVKILVIACNSAASAALDEARSRYPIPVISVIEPGVKAAIAATRNRRIGLIGTVATVDSMAYDNAVVATKSNVTLVSRACPRFVEFVERGDTTSDELVGIAAEYLLPLKDQGVDTLILGCTHYPLLTGVIQYVMGDDVVLISSADVTANEVYVQLKRASLVKDANTLGTHRFLASSEAGTFGELGAHFLGPEFRSVEYRPWRAEARSAQWD